MSHNTTPGYARHLGSAHDLVHYKHDRTIVDWAGQAELYFLTPALRGYTTVVVATNHLDLHPESHVETLIFGLEGEGLLLDWDDVGGGTGITTATEALTAAGYTTT